MSSDEQTIIQRIAMKAVIANAEGKVLIVRIADAPKAGTNAGKYSLPGGKLKPGEVWDEGLIREVKEETGLVVEVVKPLQVGEWRPVVQGKQLQIIGVFFDCRTDNFEVTLSEENDSYERVDVSTLNSFDVLEPDRTVAANYLNSL